jgi:hypothetical protein
MINNVFDTVAQCEAFRPADGEVIYCFATERFYEYEPSGAALTRDGDLFLNTGWAGNTRFKSLKFFSIRDDGEIYFLGNVGIGKSNPSSKLHVRSPDSLMVKLEKNDSNSSIIGFFNSTTGTDVTDGFQVGLGAGETALLINRENTDMVFYTNDLIRARFNNTGEFNIANLNSMQHNGVEVVGYLNDGTKSPIYGNIFSGLFAVGVGQLSLPHSISNAFTGQRILAAIPWIEDITSGNINTVYQTASPYIPLRSWYDNTNVYFTRGRTNVAANGFVFVIYR